jgi:hypothetical protein
LFEIAEQPLKLGSRVRFIRKDSDIPFGSIGTIVEWNHLFQDEYSVHVRFDDFVPNHLYPEWDDRKEVQNYLICSNRYIRKNVEAI